MAKEIKLERRKILLLRILIVILVLIIANISFIFWFKNKYQINREKDVTVKIIGVSERYTEQQIRDYTLDKWYENYWILVKWYYKFRKAEPLPYLEKITVNVSDDGKIEIRAYEKSPIGCIKEMENYLYFDTDGIIVATKNENVEKLPIITGLKYSKIVLYQPFETQKLNLFRVVMNIVQQLQKYDVEADEIHFGEEDEVYIMVKGNQFNLGTREVYDVQIGMIRGLIDRIGDYDVKYEFHLEKVEKSTDQVYATVIE